MDIVRTPRRLLSAAAGNPDLPGATRLVIFTAVASLGLDVAAAFARPAGERAADLVVSLISVLLIVGFWAGSAWVINLGAVRMGEPSRRREFLAASGRAYPLFIVCAALGGLQIASLQWFGGAGDVVATLAAWASLGVLAWFAVLTVMAISAVYQTGPLNAVALAMLPYAVLSAAALLLILVFSGLRAAGVLT